MRTAPQHTRTGLLGGAALLLVLLGVLAMHGVGGHATGHGTPSGAHTGGSVATGSPATGSPATGSLATGVVEHRAHEPATEASAHLASDPADPSWWTALCLAVLAGAALLALSAAVGVPLRVSARRPGVTTRVPGRRDRDPPSLVVLSVCRC